MDNNASLQVLQSLPLHTRVNTEEIEKEFTRVATWQQNQSDRGKHKEQFIPVVNYYSAENATKVKSELKLSLSTHRKVPVYILQERKFVKA